ncbi:MAG: hypothetical protein H0W76_21465 [Pyrinomonadaceae bacterium]|nr:hypothetical protein [Pyrinomonadaceae bacterium]
MNKRKAVIALCVLTLGTGAFAFSGQSHNAVSFTQPDRSVSKENPIPHPSPQPAQNNAALQDNQTQAVSAQPPDTTIPKHVVYGILFHEMAAFKKKAEEKEQQGEDGSFLRKHHRNKAKLNDKHAATLDRIAADTEHEVAKVDAEAKRIIDAARARHMHGKLMEGEALPAPPPELSFRQHQRDTIILRGRDQLHAVLGDKEFQRFDKHVQQEITDKVKPIKPLKGHPKDPGERDKN